ncbi:MAG: hypothetical protein ACRDQW_09995, partial [Haloechinothrix sp.]
MLPAIALVATVLAATGLVGRPVAQAGDREPGPERYGIAVTRDVPVTLSDGTVLRADIHVPADQETGQPAPGPFPVIVGLTPYGKRQSADAGSGFGGLNP